MFKYSKIEIKNNVKIRTIAFIKVALELWIASIVFAPSLARTVVLIFW